MLKRAEYFIGRNGSRIIRIAHFMRYFRIGLWHDYPICCVFHFAWDLGLFDRSPGMLRGSINYPTDRTYVPCRLHMRRHPTWLPHHDPEPRSQLRLFSDKIGRS